MCVVVLVLVMTRINDARTNLALSSPGAYNSLLQSNRNIDTFVDALRDYQYRQKNTDNEQELRREYQRRFDIVWAGFSVFEIRFPSSPVQQQQVSTLIDYSAEYLAANEDRMAVNYQLSDAEIGGLIAGASSISESLVHIGHQYFIYASHLSDQLHEKLHKLYLWFWVCAVLLVLTGSLLTTMLIRSSRRSAELVEKSHKTQDEMKRLIDELRSGKLENKAKDSFIAAASHDLRQPLHALGLFLGATEKHIESVAGRQALAEAKNCTAELNKLFNSLLDLSRLDAGVVEVNSVNFKLNRLLALVEQEFSVLAKQSGVVFNVCSSLLSVQSDAILLNRVLRNLLENAFTHSDASEIQILCESKAGTVQLTVADNGCGIAVAEQAHIFSEYFQLDNPERDRSKGLGLGLSIVKRLCEILNVDITLESEVGVGTRFHLYVPMGIANAQWERIPVEASVGSSRSFSGALVAVIDDEANIRRGMVAILESLKFNVVAAASASLMIAELKASALTPDILVVDYRLRDNQTGDMAIHLVRKAFNIDFPAMIITGDTSPGRMNEAAKSGFELLHKPVDPVELMNRITALLATITRPSTEVS